MGSYQAVSKGARVNNTKILIYDIESSNLQADWGQMLCFGYEWYGSGKTQVVSLLDTNTRCKGCSRVDTLTDAPLLKVVYDILSSADMIVSWYGREGRGFDSRFINARLLAAKLGPLPRMPQVDLHVTMRDRFKLGSNRLANVQRFLRLEEEKTPLDQFQWQKARVGDVKALKYVVDHCRQDVKVLRDAYTILRPWVVTHPRVGKWGACEVCGGPTRLRGQRALGRVVKEKVWTQCRECRHWQTAAAPREVI